MKHVNSIEDAEKELTVVETAFVTNDYTQLFIKNAKGEIRTFDMFEVIPKDEKDEIIEQLRSENNKLKGRVNVLENDVSFPISLSVMSLKLIV